MKAHLHLILRLVFGALFIWSGVAKLKSPIEFADAVRNFEMVGDPIAPALALWIPCIEILGGILAMAGLLWRGAIVTLLASLIVFSVTLAIAWARGLDISCGCFGGSGAVNYPLAIGRNLLIFAIGLIAFLNGQKSCE